MCAIKIHSASYNTYVIAVYRAPSGNFLQFLKNLETALRMVINCRAKIIVCGDININYLKESHMKKQLYVILSLYNLVPVIDFPTRSFNGKEYLIDNTFIDPFYIRITQFIPLLIVYQIMTLNC
jgi:exonuclease III